MTETKITPPGTADARASERSTAEPSCAPSVSVVIPAYNRASVLPRTIRSVLAQDYPDMEVVVVDDGSSDNTAAVVERLQAQEPRIRLLKHDTNHGEAAARNTGVRAARGEMVAFLDSDDEWLPGKLREQTALLLDASPRVGAVMSRFVTVCPDGTEIPMADWTDTHPITPLNLLARGCGLCMGDTFVIRRCVFDEVGYYDESLPVLVDLDWLCRMLEHFEIVKLEAIHARYHKAPMRQGDFMRDGIRAYESRRADYLASFGVVDRLRIKSQFFHYVSTSYLANGPWWKFVTTRLMYLVTNPFQHPGQYVHLLLVLVGLARVGPRS